MGKVIGKGIFMGSDSVRNGALLNQTITDEEAMALFGDRMAMWVKPEDETTNYFTNRIGSQDRIALGGVIHPGRAIQYDGSKSQYSATNGNMPANFRLVNNSITIFCRVKMSALPSGNSLLFGYAVASSGAYWTSIGTDGKLSLNIRHSSTISFSSINSICDGEWHDIFVLINKAGNAALYVDNILQGSPVNISSITFSDLNIPFNVGGQAAYYSGIKQIRDVRLFSSAITAEADRDAIHKGDYVDGCTSWYFMQDGKESTIYNTKDCVSANHLINYAFDSTSLVSGAWESLFNKHGYSGVNYESDDLITGDGIFDNASEWTFTASRFEVTGGIAWFKAVDSSANSCRNKRTLNIPIGTVLQCTFTIVEGPATFAFCNESLTEISPSGTYAVGTHTVIFKTLNAAIVNIGIRGYYTGGAFKIDNWVVSIYEAAIIAPKMDAAIPTKDVWNRDLIFFGQAKYNLLKVDADTVQLPDYCGELFNAAELITVNDWFNAGGEGNEIDISDIEAYQTKRQYYKAGELIIIKSDAVLTDEEDALLKKKLMLDSETYTPKTLINTAKGALTGANADIYKSKNWLTGETYSELVLKEQVTRQTDPAGKYIAIGWADFFTPEDPQIMLALCSKYGMTHTFYRQIKPLSDDPRNTLAYSRSSLKMIESQGSYDANHAFLHINHIYNHPYHDGRTFPSISDIKTERSDGTNEFGYNVDDTVDTSIGSSLRDSWLRLSATIGGKAWSALSDAECTEIIKSLGVFGMPIDGQNGLKVLESLDYLSNRYCGTTGYSVLNGDYTNTTRTPNTVDGLEPSPSNLIQGGIFQDAATTQNQEIWERILIIDEQYKREFEGKLDTHLFWSTPGGIQREFLFRPENPESAYGNYIDKMYSQLNTGVAKVTSSITGNTRSWNDCLRSKGYKVTMATSGHGYASYASDLLNRLESQSIYQRNLSYKKPDCIGDGYTNAIRQWMSTLTEADIDNALASADVEKYLYDLCSTDVRFTGMTAYESGNFAVYINEAIKFIAWGKIPDSVDDSGAAGVLLKRASMAFVHEALMRFCQRAGIKLISHEEAINMALTNYSPSNYFPNYQLSTTVKTILDSVNAPAYPDGWNGGTVIDDSGDVLSLTPGTYFIRQYAIRPGNFYLSFRSKGIATLKVKAIRNKHTYDQVGGDGFDDLTTININDANYSTHSQSVSVENATMETYTTPTTPEEKAYQAYMRGYGDKICGLHIEITVAGENTLRIGDFDLSI